MTAEQTPQMAERLKILLTTGVPAIIVVIGYLINEYFKRQQEIRLIKQDYFKKLIESMALIGGVYDTDEIKKDFSKYINAISLIAGRNVMEEINEIIKQMKKGGSGEKETKEMFNKIVLSMRKELLGRRKGKNIPELNIVSYFSSNK